jgi:orotate phosphoribosyltransferase-like protein
MPLYQQLSQKVKALKALGMLHEEIATSLQVTRKTVGKALRHLAS